MLDRNSAVERVRFEVVTTMPGGERPVGFLGGGIVGSAGVELVDVIRRVVGELMQRRRRDGKKVRVRKNRAST